MDNLPENEVLEKYLNRLCRLFLVMPEAEQAEARDEIRQHILTMIALHEAEGLSEQEAIKVTLEKFGDPGKIGEGIAKAWLKKRQAARQAALESVPPRVVTTREKVVRGLQSLCISGWIYATVIVCYCNSSFSWASLLIPAMAWGAVSGFLNVAMPPSQQEVGVLFDAATRANLQELPPLSMNANWKKRIHYHIAKRARHWLKRELENNLARLAGQKPSKFDFGKLVTRLALLGVVLVLPFRNFWAQEFVSSVIYINSGWLATDVAMRVLYRAHKVR